MVHEKERRTRRNVRGRSANVEVSSGERTADEEVTRYRRNSNIVRVNISLILPQCVEL